MDPFGREGYRAHNIRVDVLVSELNFGASSRWIDAGDALPSEILISDDDADQEVVGSTTAPPIVNDQSTATHPPASSMESSDVNVEQNYEMLGKMTTTKEATTTTEEHRVNGEMKEAPIMGPRFRRGDVSDVE